MPLVLPGRLFRLRFDGRSAKRQPESNHLVLAQAGDLGVGEAELAQDLLGVLTPLRGRCDEAARRAGERYGLADHVQDSPCIPRVDILHDAEVATCGSANTLSMVLIM